MAWIWYPLHRFTCIAMDIPTCSSTLQWRHNDHDDVSKHQPHGCLLNRLLRCRSKKTSKLRVTGHCAGNSPGPVNSPNKGPVTRKTVPFDEVIMIYFSETNQILYVSVAAIAVTNNNFSDVFQFLISFWTIIITPPMKYGMKQLNHSQTHRLHRWRLEIEK